ncbi:hypothetical protein N7495_003572 [Penicillium taxi]|uniref:uncharacterized protein n=1 Tax=Penicillium taxi TaxID=168475 RepID=UPI002544F2BA|nr:uncharacterized protein N7495_003572 [Penicillium taxi]KAJ5898828.1 hypothetical protein N7495_003572 [Penicillium taxi]
MSPCSRAAISRALRLEISRYRPTSCYRQLPPSIYPRLCVESFAPYSPSRKIQLSHRCFSTSTFQRQEAPIGDITHILPLCCPGCGAYSQTIEANEPGYYGQTQKQTRKLLASRKKAVNQNKALQLAEATDPEANEYSSVLMPTTDAAFPEEALNPQHTSIDSIEVSDPSDPLSLTPHICDRCHDLIHHNKAVSSPKPSIFSIRDLLDESPYKNNRVYHILDAADFPMSLVPRIHQALSAQDQRSHNRRSATEKYHAGKKLPTVSFVITRSDLLAATKDQVDSKMEYVRSVLRKSLGQAGKAVRLGNVHMISAHRGWWTKQLKEEIQTHGGGIWVVGKANVGKSSFIEACFPKDSKSLENIGEWIHQQRLENELLKQRQVSLFDPNSLLPPAPREDIYPVLPVVSSMPGTTVSPIRIPFGRGKGEVIDLPGMERTELEDFVRDEHKRDLIMTKRIKPTRITVKPGQSLLLGGGLVRITAVNPEDTILAACFVPIGTHITRTDKAIEMQTEERAYPGTSILKEGAGSSISSAGKFDLKWDITSSNLPSLVAKAVKDKGVPIPALPYRVMAADILIEGCGWIEVSIQIRAKRSAEDDLPAYPQLEVFTPNGNHIGSRRPIGCWDFIAEKLKADKRNRPRMRYRYS